MACFVIIIIIVVFGFDFFIPQKLNREKHAVQVMKEELEAKEKEVEQLRKEKEAMVVAKTAHVS